MSALRFLGSPLAGTAAVLAGLCLLAVPLHRLTSSPSASESPPATAPVSTPEIPAVLRVKLLAPVQRLIVKGANGAIFLDKPFPAAGESEHDVVLAMADEGLDLSLSADFGEAATETAVFLTVMPDGHEEQTRYAIGSGVFEESLHYQWNHAR